MPPKIVAVKVLEDYLLLLTYETGEIRRLDMNPWLDLGIFRELKKHPGLFNQVRPFHNTIEWPNEADLDPETVWEESSPV